MQSRRQFILKGAKLVAVGAAASAGPSLFVRGAGAADKQLKVLQWAHFVPAYEKWFDSTCSSAWRAPYHKKVWTDIGMLSGPATYEDLVKAAPEIKPEIKQVAPS